MPTPRGKGGHQPPPSPPPVKTGGGGDDDEGDGRSIRSQLDELSKHVGPAEEEHEEAIVKHRRDVFAGKDTESRIPEGYEFSFSSESLLGSWFHKLENDEIVWQGQVIAEPAHATYLVEIEQMEPAARNVQRLIKLDQMTNDDEGYDWRFYDSRDEAMKAYQEWVLAGKQRA